MRTGARRIVWLACAVLLGSGCGSGGTVPAGTGADGPGGPAGGATCDDHPAVTDAARCRATVQGLNSALAGALDLVLPATAEVSNNLFDAGGGNVGGAGVAFVPRASDTGTDAYEASVRIRDRDRSAVMHVTVERYATAPSDPQCRTDEMVADATAKGVAILRCDLTATNDGAVVITRADDYPYDQARTVLLPARSVAAYRPDGVMVLVSIEGVVESTPPAGIATGLTVPSMLSLDQLGLIAHDPAMAIAS